MATGVPAADTDWTCTDVPVCGASIIWPLPM